jgi:hypothetical protein
MDLNLMVRQKRIESTQRLLDEERQRLQHDTESKSKRVEERIQQLLHQAGVNPPSDTPPADTPTTGTPATVSPATGPANP